MLFRSVWNEACENVVLRFYDRLEESFKDNEIMINNERWGAHRTDSQYVNTAVFWFYPERHREEGFGYVSTLFYQRSKFKLPSLNLEVAWYYDDEKENEKYKKKERECEKFFKSKGNNLRTYKASYYHEEIFGKDYTQKLEGENAFAEWIISQGENAVANFIEILKYFISLPPIQKAMSEIDSFTKRVK